jgi:hypothetical protein
MWLVSCHTCVFAPSRGARGKGERQGSDNTPTAPPLLLSFSLCSLFFCACHRSTPPPPHHHTHMSLMMGGARVRRFFCLFFFPSSSKIVFLSPSLPSFLPLPSLRCMCVTKCVRPIDARACGGDDTTDGGVTTCSIITSKHNNNNDSFVCSTMSVEKIGGKAGGRTGAEVTWKIASCPVAAPSLVPYPPSISLVPAACIAGINCERRGRWWWSFLLLLLLFPPPPASASTIPAATHATGSTGRPPIEKKNILRVCLFFSRAGGGPSKGPGRSLSSLFFGVYVC